MKKLISLSIILLIVVACKTDKNESKIIENSKPVIIEEKASSFEESLLDFRDVNKALTEGYKVKKFGIKKNNDSVFSFVFKLDEVTTDETVLAYSIGIRGWFDSNNISQYKTSFSPKLKIIEGENYLILRRNLEHIRYFDSIYVYIYERKNWKKSGNLGGFKIRDILFEN